MILGLEKMSFLLDEVFHRKKVFENSIFARLTFSASVFLSVILGKVLTNERMLENLCARKKFIRIRFLAHVSGRMIS